MREEKGKKIAFGILFFLIDRLLKYFVLFSGSGFINKGISFGALLPHGLDLRLLSFVLLFVLVIVMYRLNKFGWGGILILAGGLSNLMDRFVYGGIVDFLKLPFLPIFNNLSDYYIFFGIILLLVDFMKSKKVS